MMFELELLLSVLKAHKSSTESEHGRPNMKLRKKKSTDFGRQKSEVSFLCRETLSIVFSLSTASSPRSMQTPPQFRLSETKHSECRYERFIIHLHDLLLSTFLIAATVPRCSASLTAAVPLLRRQHEERYCTVHRNVLVSRQSVCISP